MNLQDLQNTHPCKNIDSIIVSYTNPNFYPRVPAFDAFQSVAERDMKKLYDITRDRKDFNIRKQEEMAIKQIMENKNIIIKMAYKGGKVVIMDSSTYREIALSIRKLTLDPTDIFKASMKERIEEGVAIGAFTERQAKFLCPEHPTHAIFHRLSKIHNEFTPR